MLLEKIQTNEVYCFKLVNGDEVIARLESSDNDNFTLNKPTTLVPSSQGIGLMQSMIAMKQDSTVKVSRSHIIMYSEVDPRMRDHYIQTTTGIQPVTKDKIII